MINEPTVDKLVEKIGSKYGLCVVAAKRARQLIDQAQNQGYSDLPGKYKPVTLAAMEIDSGKVICVKD